ncbi:MAG TPA: hypothetical protein VH255_04235 [Verrucomicrobiae bacterium]|nr:hypothetical protein [Verrucomicrobiae bacterium]
MKKAASKWILLPALVGSTFLMGCARQYTMTLQNGSQISVIGKPKVVGGSYVAHDADGNLIRQPIVTVREIAPASMASSGQSSGFSAAPSKQ